MRTAIFKYRVCGKVGTPWSTATLEFSHDKKGNVVFNFKNKNAEVGMNFYRKFYDYIEEGKGNIITCDAEILAEAQLIIH